MIIVFSIISILVSIVLAIMLLSKRDDRIRRKIESAIPIEQRMQEFAQDCDREIISLAEVVENHNAG